MDTLLKIKNITEDWRIVLDTGNPYKALEEVIEFEKSTDPIAMEIKKMRAEFEESLGC